MKRIKNFAAGMMIAAVFTVMSAGCGSEQNTEKTAGESTKAVSRTAGAVSPSAETEGRVANSDGNVVTDVKERGLSFTISPDFMDKGVELDSYNENIKGYRMITISYYSPTYRKLLDEIIDMDPEERTPEVTEQYTREMWGTMRTLMEIAIVETDRYKELTASGKVPEDFTFNTPAEWFGTNDGYTYIISIPELDNGMLNEAEQKVYHECKNYMQDVKESLSFIPIEPEQNETVIGAGVPLFKTEDLYGNVITNDIFKQKKLTVVNVWGTFCGPCIEEMPELAVWSGKMPDDVQLIGLVGDIAGREDTEHVELARKIVEKAGADFVTIIANDDLKDLMNGIIGYPTTFFVDQDGNIVGEPIVGADVAGYKKFVEDYFGE